METILLIIGGIILLYLVLCVSDPPKSGISRYLKELEKLNEK